MSASHASRTSVTPREALRGRSETLDLRLPGLELLDSPNVMIAKTYSRSPLLRNQPAHLLRLPPPLDPDRHRRGAIGDPVMFGPCDNHSPGAVERPFEPI